jgi:hypothetical protein
MSAISSSFNFDLKFQDLPLYKMSRAELKEGHKALHKGDFNAAIEFYNMVCYCSFCGPEVNFFALLLLSHLYNCTGLNHYLIFFCMLVQTIHDFIIFSYSFLLLYFSM